MRENRSLSVLKDTVYNLCYDGAECVVFIQLLAKNLLDVSNLVPIGYEYVYARHLSSL